MDDETNEKEDDNFNVVMYYCGYFLYALKWIFAWLIHKRKVFKSFDSTLNMLNQKFRHSAKNEYFFQNQNM